MPNSWKAYPVLPAADVAASLTWWTEICGFAEVFRHPQSDEASPTYAGVEAHGASVHFAAVTDKALARTVGDQTMLRVVVDDLDVFYAAYL